LRQTSPQDLSVKQCSFDNDQTSDFGHRLPHNIPVNKPTTSDLLTANDGTVGIPCNLQLYPAGFRLNRKCKFAVDHSILTWRYLYIPQNFPLLFVIIFLTLPQQQVKAPHVPQPPAIESKSSRTTGDSSNAPPAETQQQCSHHQIVDHIAANASTENMTRDSHLKTVYKTGQSKNRKLHPMGCE